MSDPCGWLSGVVAYDSCVWHAHHMTTPPETAITNDVIDYLAALVDLDTKDQIDFRAHAATLIMVCRPTAFMSVGDAAKLIGRNRNTVLSWIERGQHRWPAPLGRTGLGQIWDAADIDAWAEAHPGLCWSVDAS